MLWIGILLTMGLPRACKAHAKVGKKVAKKKVDAKLGKKEAKKTFTKLCAKELELAKEWFRNDLEGAAHLFVRQRTPHETVQP